jgi:hypothetical protein
MPGDELILSVDVSSVCVLGDQRSFAKPVTDDALIEQAIERTPPVSDFGFERIQNIH